MKRFKTAFTVFLLPLRNENFVTVRRCGNAGSIDAVVGKALANRAGLPDSSGAIGPRLIVLMLAAVRWEKARLVDGNSDEAGAIGGDDVLLEPSVAASMLFRCSNCWQVATRRQTPTTARRNIFRGFGGYILLLVTTDQIMFVS